MTNHGGIVVEADDSFIVDGKGVHLEGMKHFCPKCKKIVTAISLGKGFVVVGSRTIIIAQQQLAVRDAGSGSGGSVSSTLLANSLSNLLFSDRFLLVDRITGEAFSNIPYKIHREDGRTEEGMTDDEGYTTTIFNRSEAEEIHIEIKYSDFDIDEFLLCNF